MNEDWSKGSSSHGHSVTAILQCSKNHNPKLLMKTTMKQLVITGFFLVFLNSYEGDRQFIRSQANVLFTFMSGMWEEEVKNEIPFSLTDRQTDRQNE